MAQVPPGRSPSWGRPISALHKTPLPSPAPPSRWIVAASIVTKNTQGVSLPDDDYRTAVMAMSWAEAGLFALLLVSGIARACS